MYTDLNFCRWFFVTACVLGLYN